MVGRIIFLDIDGVLNTADKYDILTTMRAPGMRFPYVVDMNKVAAFNYVLEQTPFIRVVVSSTWRLPALDHGVTMDTLAEFCKLTHLSKRIFHPDWKTPLIGEGANRKLEVDAWIEQHPECFKFAVIDDNYKDQFQNDVSFKFIKTDGQVGLTFDILKKLLNVFGVRVRHDYSVTTAGGPMIL